MPFLRAALLPHKKPKNEPEAKRESPKMPIRTLEDLVIAKAVKAWIYLDDLATQKELARLGL